MLSPLALELYCAPQETQPGWSRPSLCRAPQTYIDPWITQGKIKPLTSLQAGPGTSPCVVRGDDEYLESSEHMGWGDIDVRCFLSSAPRLSELQFGGCS